MSEQRLTGAGQKLVPIGAPALGAVIMIAFVALAFSMGKFDATSVAITAKAEQVTKTLNEPKPTEPPIVSVNSQKLNVRIAEPEKREFPASIKDQELAATLPLRFRVMLDQPPGPEETAFDKLDINRKDGKISKAEFLARTDKTKEELEEEFIKRDTEPKDLFLSRAEFSKTLEGPPPEKVEFDLGPPTAVKAALDYVNPAVTVTWERPALTDAPDDVQYLLYRAGPEYFLKRNTEYRENALKKFIEEDQAYEQAYRDWKVGPNAGKARKQFAEETKKPEPVKPLPPAEWELLTPAPISDVTYIDKSFELDCAFIYAVCMVTAKKPKPGIVVNKKAMEGYSASEPAIQAGHPVYFPNRTTLSFVEVTDTLLTVRLGRWHKIGDAWRQVRAKFSAEPQAYLGRKIKVSELTDKDSKYELQALAEDGNPNDALLALLDPKEDINFDSGWRFEARNSPNEPQISNKAGDVYVLPKATRDPAAAPISAGAMVNPVEYRVIGVRPDSARFELTRWHLSGKNWVRVVVLQEVKRDGVVGVRGKLTDLAKDAKTCTIFDMSDNKVSNVGTLAPQEISLETSTKFVKLNGRTIDLGDSRVLDVFGTQFAE